MSRIKDKEPNPAQQAAARRSAEKKKSNDNLRQKNYMVIFGFMATMVFMLIYTVANPKKNFAETPAVDESAILVHNGANYRYKQGPNSFFDDKNISELKNLFDVSLSDTPNLPGCKSGEEAEVAKTTLPDSYDWRKTYPGCEPQEFRMPQNCSAAHIYSTLSAVQDHICAGSNRNLTVTLSPQELLDCPKGARACKGGSVNQVLSWGKRKGFIAESCYAMKHQDEQDGICPDDHLEDNDCRLQNSVYKTVDFCFAQTPDGVKREILKNGPVIAQISVATDFLTYSEGIYHRTQESFKFQGNHIVKVVGWETGDDEGGQSFWIAQNVWGSDWGENGFAKINMGETQIDQYAIGFAAYPMTMAEYDAQLKASQQQQVKVTPQETKAVEQPDETVNLDEMEDLNLEDEAETIDQEEL